MRTIWQLVISILNACLGALVACHVLNIVRYNLTGVAVPYGTVTYVALFLGWPRPGRGVSQVLQQVVRVPVYVDKRM